MPINRTAWRTGSTCAAERDRPNTGGYGMVCREGQRKTGRWGGRDWMPNCMQTVCRAWARKVDKMMYSRLASGRTFRIAISRAFASLTLMMLVAAPVAAQATGNGFLFDEPPGVFSFRAWYSPVKAGSDLFTSQEQQLTIGPRGFDAVSLGLDLGFSGSRRLDVGASLERTIRPRGAEYRSLLGNKTQ